MSNISVSIPSCRRRRVFSPSQSVSFPCGEEAEERILLFFPPAPGEDTAAAARLVTRFPFTLLDGAEVVVPGLVACLGVCCKVVPVCVATFPWVGDFVGTFFRIVFFFPSPAGREEVVVKECSSSCSSERCGGVSLYSTPTSLFHSGLMDPKTSPLAPRGFSFNRTLLGLGPLPSLPRIPAPALDRDGKGG